MNTLNDSPLVQQAPRKFIIDMVGDNKFIISERIPVYCPNGGILFMDHLWSGFITAEEAGHQLALLLQEVRHG
jgi:hypothetical protein